MTSAANEVSWSTIVLTVLPLEDLALASTAIFLERSPFATAVVTLVMLWTRGLVRLVAIPLFATRALPLTPCTFA